MTEEFTIHEISLGFPHDKEMLVRFLSDHERFLKMTSKLPSAFLTRTRLCWAAAAAPETF